MCDGQTAGSTGGDTMVSEALFACTFNCHALLVAGSRGSKSTDAVGAFRSATCEQFNKFHT